MGRLRCIPLLRSVVLLATLNICFSAASAFGANHPRMHRTSEFASWMNGVLLSQPGSAPSSPDNWLGGMGNWSNPADWSAGEPGTGSDVVINTGNDNVTLDVNGSINSLTLGGTSGSSTLANTNESSLTVAGALTINQIGTLTFNGGFNGFSDVTVGGATMNAGTINLSLAQLQTASITNSGSINLSVGFAMATGAINNSGAITGIDDVDSVSSGGDFSNSGSVGVYNVSVGGTLTNQAGGGISAQHLTVTGNLINMGDVSGFMNGSQFSVAGTLTNSGRFDIDYSGVTVGTLNNLTNGLIVGDGSITVGGTASNAGGIVIGSSEFAPSAILEIEGNLMNSGGVGIYSDGGSGSARVAGNITNSGSIEVSAGGSLDAVGNVINSGTIATGQGIYQGGNNSFAVGGTLTNQAGGVLSLNAVGDVANIGYVNNAGSVSIASGARLNVIGGSHASANAFPGFLNSGTLLIAQGGTFSSPLNFTQTAGQATVDGTLRINGNAIANFSGGDVYGNGGTIQGNVISNAAFNMGDMPMTVGMMAITGNYRQGAAGSLAFDIASLTSFDQLNVSGRANLNGTLFVDLLNGYVPQIGNMFDIMNFSGESGTFSMVVGLPINNNEHFVLEYNSTNLTLDVVSGPDQQSPGGKGSAYYEPYASQVTDGIDQFGDSSAGLSSVPEPGSLVLLASGIICLLAARRKILP